MIIKAQLRFNLIIKAQLKHISGPLAHDHFYELCQQGNKSTAIQIELVRTNSNTNQFNLNKTQLDQTKQREWPTLLNHQSPAHT